VEGKIPDALRLYGLRQGRYFGQEKTDLRSASDCDGLYGQHQETITPCPRTTRSLRIGCEERWQLETGRTPGLGVEAPVFSHALLTWIKSVAS
jgi:hypothetical protein